VWFSSRRAEPAPAAPSPEQAAAPYAIDSPEGLVVRWTRWAANAPMMEDPIDDRTGEYADRRQPDDVFFLAGSYGKVVERRCMVPPGRDLFLPVFNMWQFGDQPHEGVEQAHGVLEVDGTPIRPDLIVTPVPFLVTGTRMNGVTNSKKPVSMTVWGLWKRVPALPLGEHHLRAVGGAGKFTVDVTYRFVVAPLAAPLVWPS
jgi:hypothetical protein